MYYYALSASALQDKVVLRYRMYAGQTCDGSCASSTISTAAKSRASAGVTSPYTNSGGLQSKFHAETGSIRKSEETQLP